MELHSLMRGLVSQHCMPPVTYDCFAAFLLCLPCSRAFPIVPPDAAALAAPPPAAVQALWVGHASLLVQLEGLAFMTDPLFSQRPSPVQFMGPRR